MLVPVIPEPIITISAVGGRVGDLTSTSSGKGGSSCQNEEVGFGTGRPGEVFMRARAALNSVLRSEKVWKTARRFR